MSHETEKTLVLDRDELLAFCGPNDQKIRVIQDTLQASILTRGNELVISGSPASVSQTLALAEDLLSVQRKTGHALSLREVELAVRTAKDSRHDSPSVAEVFMEHIPLPNRACRLAPVTPGQKQYIDAMRKNDIVCAIGPAGTGKTYLAVAMAVWSLTQKFVKRIILVRPAVEAGERLGFLPGDIAAKFDPFVRPLYDALYEMMEPEKVKLYLETGIIEIAPLAFMRGRTLSHSFVILDEGQNTTSAQMKMFLTRLGEGSKAIVTGDITQIDLPSGTVSGIVHMQKVLKKVRGIKFVTFHKEDVVRHDLVQRIVKAYEEYSEKR